ncbi:MAG: DUF1588 domain-containing protein [Rhodospirillaceae bacterium]
MKLFRPLSHRTSAGAAICLALALTGCNAPEKTAAETASVAVAEATPVLADQSSPARRRLMTGQQYLNTITAIFGSDIQIISPFAPLQRTDGLLASGAASAGVPSGELQQFQRAAATIAGQVVDDGNLRLRVPSHRDSLIPCKPAAADKPDAACAGLFLKATGRLLYRHPLSDAKVAALVDEAGKATVQLNDFYAGLASVLEGMLISPDVLFVYDRTEPDPKNPKRRRLDAYSYAARLSFFLWNAAPDDRLLKAAESGELNTDKGRAKIVDMMLSSPRMEAGVRAFFDDMFAFDAFDNLAKDAGVYPLETGQTLSDAREQTLRTAYDHLIVKKQDYRDLYTTRATFMSPALGAIYHVPTTPGWVPYEFPEGSPRVGLLSQVSFLAVNAHPGRSSATRRGKAMRELLLCQKVPLPPPNVDFSIVEDPKATFKTARDRVTAHLHNPVCAGCHRITDPVGLALENYDGAGQFRDTERGAVIDASGSLDGKDFKDMAGLAAALHDHPALPTCLVKRLYSYGTGGPLSDGDQDELAFLNDRFAKGGYRLPALFKTIVLSPAFRDVTPRAPAVKTADSVTTAK